MVDTEGEELEEKKHWKDDDLGLPRWPLHRVVPLRCHLLPGWHGRAERGACAWRDKVSKSWSKAFWRQIGLRI